MPFQCKVSPLLTDIVPFVRSQIEDLSGVNIPDSSFTNSIAHIVQDLTRFFPITRQVGDIFAENSPLLTVAGQQRYVCNSGNGFVGSVAQISDVLYRATGAISGASEFSYIFLLPFSPTSTFLLGSSTIDTPSNRIKRDEYLNELDHYGLGKAGVVVDSSGYFALDLYPVPGETGLPIYVRYESIHDITTDMTGNMSIPTLPVKAIRYFQLLLQAAILRELSTRSAQQKQATAGMIQVVFDPMMLRTHARDLQEQAYQEMGVGQGMGIASS